MLVLAGCDGTKTAAGREDASIETKDAVPSVGTDVAGSLGGASFRLRYGAVKRGASETDPIWVCAADVPVTYADCDSTMGPDRMMFLGPFIYDANGVPKWGLPQVWLYRVGSNPLSAWANSGSLSVLHDDPVSGALQLTLSVDFGEATPTMGSLMVGF